MRPTIRKTWHYIQAALLLLTSPFCFADSSSLSNIAFGSDQVKNYTDISVSYLSQLLGTVGNVLHGTSGQLLGQMFYVFNTGILIAAGIWLCYTVLTILLKSSHEGSFSGQNRNAAVIFLKIALGIAFLVPSPTTGYNVLQAIVAKVVVAGVDLADSMWNKALDYMSEGGTMFSFDSMITTDPYGNSDINSNIIQPGDSKKAIQAIQTVLSNTTCFYQANSTRSSSASLIVDNDKYQLQFPGPGDDPNATSLAHPACGYISWDVNSYCSNAGKSTDDGTYATKCSYYQQAIYQVVTDLWQTGLTYANYYPINTDDNNTGSTSLTPDDLKDEAQTAIVNAFIDYINLALPATRIDSVNNAINQALNGDQNFFTHTARDGGWITAGEFYWSLIQYNSNISKSESLLTVPISKNYTAGDTDHTASASTNVFGPPSSTLVDGSNYKVANAAIIALPSTEMLNSLKSELTSLDPSLESVFTYDEEYSWTLPEGTHGMAVIGRGFKLLLAHIIDVGNPITDVIKAMTDTTKHPLIWASELGKKLLDMAATLLGSLTVIIGSLSMLGGLGATAGASFPILSVINWVASPLAKGIGVIFQIFWMPVILIGFVGGMVLTFYLPLYPYFIFTFGVAAWLIQVVEGMMAAPIVALGLTHPEGHDFLGRAEQSLILLLNLFIRPAAMIMGLMAAIPLAVILMELIQHGIARIFVAMQLSIIGVEEHLSPKDLVNLLFSKYSTSGPLIFMLLLSIYIFFIYQVIVKAFSLIYVIPNRLLRWIGGFEQQDDSAMLAEQQKGILMQGGFQGAKSQTDALSQQIKGVGSSKKKKKEKEEE